MYLADSLSPAPRCSIVDQEENNFDVGYISSSYLEELKRHTADDTTLETLSTVIGPCHLPLLSLQR